MGSAALGVTGSTGFLTTEVFVSGGVMLGVVAGAAVSLDWHWVSAKIAKAIAMMARVILLLFDFIKLLLGFIVSNEFSVSFSV